MRGFEDMDPLRMILSDNIVLCCYFSNFWFDIGYYVSIKTLLKDNELLYEEYYRSMIHQLYDI